MNPFDPVSWLQDWQEKRAIQKSKQYTQTVASGFWELFNLSLTWHGRYKLIKVIEKSDKDEVYLDPKIKDLYRFVLASAPYEVYSNLN